MWLNDIFFLSFLNESFLNVNDYKPWGSYVCNRETINSLCKLENLYHPLFILKQITKAFFLCCFHFSPFKNNGFILTEWNLHLWLTWHANLKPLGVYIVSVHTLVVGLTDVWLKTVFSFLLPWGAKLDFSKFTISLSSFYFTGSISGRSLDSQPEILSSFLKIFEKSGTQIPKRM